MPHHISVRRYTDANCDEWDAFVAKANNGTMFHTRRFLSYHPPERFIDHSLLIVRTNRTAALVPAIEIIIDKDKVLYSHRGASYGGFVHDDIGIEDAIAWIQALKQYAREREFSKIILTHPPMLYSKQPSNYLDFAMIQSGFRYQKRELSAMVKLTPSHPSSNTDSILGMFKQEARTATRKAIKSGITVQISEDYEAYYEILAHNLMLRHGVQPTHTLAELQTLARLFPNNIFLHAAYLENRMIAGVLNFIASPNTVLGFYISDNKVFQEYRSLNYLFYSIFEWCQAQGIEWYDFGTFTLNMEPNIGLGKFKETFGARGIFRDTMEILI